MLVIWLPLLTDVPLSQTGARISWVRTSHLLTDRVPVARGHEWRCPFHRGRYDLGVTLGRPRMVLGYSPDPPAAHQVQYGRLAQHAAAYSHYPGHIPGGPVRAGSPNPLTRNEFSLLCAYYSSHLASIHNLIIYKSPNYWVHSSIMLEIVAVTRSLAIHIALFQVVSSCSVSISPIWNVLSEELEPCLLAP